MKEQDSRTSHVDEYQHGHLGNVVGIYFPMGHGERVSELWLRTGEYGDDAIEADTMIVRVLVNPSSGPCGSLSLTML